MRILTSTILLAGALFLFCTEVGAIAAESSSLPSGTVACEGFAYTIDLDPKGLNVRSGPQKESSVLFVIPYDPEGTSVTLAGSFGDWVLVRSAQGLTSGFESQKEGWVYSPLLAVRAAHPSGRKVPLYSKPDKAGSVIKIFDVETEVRLAGCMGDWLQVRIGPLKGWLTRSDYCGNPVTTCP